MWQVRENHVRVLARVNKSADSPVQTFVGLGPNKKAAQLAAAKCALRRLTSHSQVGDIAA